MPNFIQNMYNNFTNDIASRLAMTIAQTAQTAEEYWQGKQRENLKLKTGQYNDNVTINLFGLVIDRNVSQMIGGGVEYVVEGEDGETTLPEGDWIRACMEANKEELLLHRSALSAGLNGTGYWYLLAPPASMIGDDGKEYPRILVWNPGMVTMKTLQGDYEVIIQYTHQYFEQDEAAQQTGYRKVVARDMTAQVETWTITDYIQHPNHSNWERIAPPVVWPWPFCPVTHWQNLPTVANCYGSPDLEEDKKKLQDAINADASVIRKNIRLLSNPRIWTKGSSKPETVDAGPDKIIHMGSDGELHVEPALGDLIAARDFVNWEKAVFMDGARTVDIHSLADKLGSLTNFALRVLYQDNVNKIETKRELFGDALEQLLQRLQIMQGMTPVRVEVEWPDFVPVNELEEVQAEQIKLGMQVESKQAAAEALGLDWTVESDRIDAEKQATDNVGTFLINAFNRNGGG